MGDAPGLSVGWKRVGAVHGRSPGQSPGRPSLEEPGGGTPPTGSGNPATEGRYRELKCTAQLMAENKFGSYVLCVVF